MDQINASLKRNNTVKPINNTTRRGLRKAAATAAVPPGPAAVAVKDYIIVSNGGKQFLNDIKEKLTMGYVPQGGISTVVSGMYVTFFQAMVKY